MTEELKVWVALCAVGDDPNEQLTDILGVFSSEEKALEIAKRVGPRTGEAEGFVLDSDRDAA